MLEPNWTLKRIPPKEGKHVTLQLPLYPLSISGVTGSAQNSPSSLEILASCHALEPLLVYPGSHEGKAVSHS